MADENTIGGWNQSHVNKAQAAQASSANFVSADTSILDQALKGDECRMDGHGVLLSPCSESRSWLDSNIHDAGKAYEGAMAVFDKVPK